MVLAFAELDECVWRFLLLPNSNHRSLHRGRCSGRPATTQEEDPRNNANDGGDPQQQREGGEEEIKVRL